MKAESSKIINCFSSCRNISTVVAGPMENRLPFSNPMAIPVYDTKPVTGGTTTWIPGRGGKAGKKACCLLR